MILLVCGGRDYNDARFLESVLNQVHSYCTIDVLIEGEAIGADSLAFNWAFNRLVHVAAVAPYWDELGRGAGPRRNAAMAALRPDLVIAFAGGKGTSSMVEEALKYTPHNVIRFMYRTDSDARREYRISQRKSPQSSIGTSQDIFQGWQTPEGYTVKIEE